jgi:FMN reductase
MTTPTIAVVSAGLSQPSSTRLLANQLANATRRTLGSPVDILVIELRELAYDVMNNLVTGFPSPELKQAIEDVATADGLIAVSPIFNASYSGLFKSFFDVLDVDVLTGKPVLIAATGGTERHSLALDHALRPMFSHLRAIVVPTAVYAASSDWGATSDDHSGLAERVERAASEFANLVTSVDRPRQADPYADAMSFEQ